MLALRDALPEDTRVQLEWLEVVASGGQDRPSVVQCAVMCLSSAREETHIGSALVRGD